MDRSLANLIVGAPAHHRHRSSKLWPPRLRRNREAVRLWRPIILAALASLGGIGFAVYMITVRRRMEGVLTSQPIITFGVVGCPGAPVQT